MVLQCRCRYEWNCILIRHGIGYRICNNKSSNACCAWFMRSKKGKTSKGIKPLIGTASHIGFTLCSRHFFLDLWLFLTLFQKKVPACICKIIREHQNISYSLSKREQILIRKCHSLHDLSNRTVFRLVQEQCLEDVIVERGVVLAGPFTVWTEVQLQDLRLHDILTW